MKFCIILGTRPEIIKMSPIIRECEKQGLDYFIIHTGQHYSYDMDRIFFEELKLPLPRYHLDVGSGSHGHQTGKMLAGIEDILAKEKPGIVYVQGDTNTVLAGALAASKLQVKIGHVEAGLRSFDRSMPEEINRIVADHISDLLFAPTGTCERAAVERGHSGKQNLRHRQHDRRRGLRELEDRPDSDILEKLGVAPGRYMLSTIHRQENTDDKHRLAEIFRGLGMVSNELGMPVILPLHPRTRKMLATFGIDIPAGIRLIDPLGFMDFLKTESNARLVLTDSGGVQEECCILGVPCVTIRENTERPETVLVGANVIAGFDSEGIVNASRTMLDRASKWSNPFGDGFAGNKIIDISRACCDK